MDIKQEESQSEKASGKANFMTHSRSHPASPSSPPRPQLQPHRKFLGDPSFLGRDYRYGCMDIMVRTVNLLRSRFSCSCMAAH